MTELQVLDELIPAFDDDGDWDDVLRRAGRRRRTRTLVAAFAVAAAVFAVAPALAVLLRHDGRGLPDAADRNNVAVVIQPKTGRVLLEVAPWKGHAGFCYSALRMRSGCVPRKKVGTLVLRPPLFGWTFDDRVRSGIATTRAGKHLKLTVVHFGGKVDATLFLIRDRLPRMLHEVELRDASGKTVVRLRTP